MQLDIFEHSRDVVLRNAAIDALRARDTGACVQAVAALAAEYGADPLLAELAWMAPQRAQVLAPRLELPALDRLVRDFDAGFEGEGTPDDFTWFPAWALIADNRLGECLRLSRGGTNTRSEYCARNVLDLLLFERQGRHAELVEGRRKLREAHPTLFARYMQGR
jgi:hypothetical protein